MLSVICAESLARHILSDTNVNIIPIPDTEKHSNVSQHANDRTCTVCNRDSIESVLILYEYDKASRSKINRAKIKIMPIGNGHVDCYFLDQLNIRQYNETMKILGVNLGKDEALCKNGNWEAKMYAIKKVLNL